MYTCHPWDEVTHPPLPWMRWDVWQKDTAMKHHSHDRAALVRSGQGEVVVQSGRVRGCVVSRIQARAPTCS